jgi:hypothetical protein
MGIKCKEKDCDKKILELSFRFDGDHFKINQIRTLLQQVPYLKLTLVKIFQKCINVHDHRAMISTHVINLLMPLFSFLLKMNTVQGACPLMLPIFTESPPQFPI